MNAPNSDLAPNAPRFSGAPGHVESYFLRANDPRSERALWLKTTILAPLNGPAVAETWFIWFSPSRTIAHKDTHPLAGTNFSLEKVTVGSWAFEPNQRISGEIRGKRFDLGLEKVAHPVAAPLSIYPWRALREGPFPKSKLLTPAPWVRFSGTVDLGDETIDLTGWEGMQGHNWGKEHAYEYVWGQCLFPGELPAMMEGFTGRVQIAGRTTPRMSALVVRRGTEEYRFDRIFDFWRQDAALEGDRWNLRLFGSGGEARLKMDAGGRPMVCLGYQNPGGEMRYCFNSKLARVELAVQPKTGPAFELSSAHGGALEFLRSTPDPRFPEVV